MRGRACQEVGIRGAKAGSQERENSLGSLYCRGEGTEEGERRGEREGGRARPLGGLWGRSGREPGGGGGAQVGRFFLLNLISQVMHDCGGRVGERRISVKGGSEKHP